MTIARGPSRVLRTDPGDDLAKALLEVLKQAHYQPMSRSQLRAALGIRGDRNRDLRAVLKDLEQCGKVVKQGRRYAALAPSEGRSGRAQLIVGPIRFGRSGHGTVGGEDATPVFVPMPLRGGACPGDIVEAQLFTDRFGRPSARVTQVRERMRPRFLGLYLAEGRRGGRIVPADPSLDRTVWVDPEATGGAHDGDLVVVSVNVFPTHARGGMRATITRVIGPLDDPATDMPRVIEERQLRTEFPPDVEAEAMRRAHAPGAAEINVPGRADLRHLTCFTLDGVDSRDFDDAIGLEAGPEGRHVLWVHIADVSHYVTEGSPLEREALERATSIYFPEGAIPMLPRALSEDACSLNPGQDRLAMTVKMVLSRTGERLSTQMVPSVIRSAARLTYTQVEGYLVDSNTEAEDSLGPLAPTLVRMRRLAGQLRAKRMARGSLDLAMVEPHVETGPDGSVLAIRPMGDPVARGIVEEFMIAANEAVATFALGHRAPWLYRIHESPSREKIEELAKVARLLGVPLEGGDPGDPSTLASFLKRIEGQPAGDFLRTLCLRSLKQARYDPGFLGHFGLASPGYLHFTSPIRRYPDLLVHRVLKAILGFAPVPSDTMARIAGSITDRAQRSSQRERIAQDAERRIVAIKAARYMTHHLAKPLKARVSGVTPIGLFVTLESALVDGLIPIRSLPRDFYRCEDHKLTGETRGHSYRLGDALLVRAVSADPFLGEITFALARPGGIGARPVDRGDSDAPSLGPRSWRNGVFPGPRRA